jgi:hypothetical protein
MPPPHSEISNGWKGEKTSHYPQQAFSSFGGVMLELADLLLSQNSFKTSL